METRRSLWIIVRDALAVVATIALSTGMAQAADAKKPPFVMGVSNDSVANPFRVQMINEINYFAEQHPDLIKTLIVLNAG